MGLILDALLETVLNYDRDYTFIFKQTKESNIAVLKYKDDGFDVQEILCDFLGKVPPERGDKITLGFDSAVLKTWKRDDNDPTKVTLEYWNPKEEKDEIFVPAKFRETAPAE